MEPDLVDRTTTLAPGWLRPTWTEVEAYAGAARWLYWMTCVYQDNLDRPIPQITFEHPDPHAVRMLEACLEGPGRGQSAESLLDWILWALGDPVFGRWYPYSVPHDVHAYWYSRFDAGLLLRHPADYMAAISELLVGGSRGQKSSGYFATPMALAVSTADMILAGGVDKRASVMDPAVGSGSMLLPASNYSLNLYGVELNLTLVKACHVNAWLYVPWLVPLWRTVDGMEASHWPRVLWGNSLTLENLYVTRGWLDQEPPNTPPPTRPTLSKSEERAHRKRITVDWADWTPERMERRAQALVDEYGGVFFRKPTMMERMFAYERKLEFEADMRRIFHKIEKVLR